MPPQRKLRAILPGLAVFAAMAFGASGAFGADAHYEGISADGAVAVFSTTDKLVPGDTDIQRDIYVRDFEAGFGYVTREASLGPSGGNDAFAAQFLAIDPSGEQVFFSTRERLAANDKDSATDIYVRNLQSNTTTLVSAGSPSCSGSGCGNGDVDAGAVAEGVVDDGNQVFFITSERLSTQDSDESPDVYVRDIGAGTTTLVSAAGSPCSGSCGTGAKPAFFQGVSADGAKAIFTTGESLVSGDTDNEADLYERNLTSGETKLVSTPGAGPEACPAGHNCEPANSGISADGSHVFFETNEKIAVADGDDAQDVYDWSAGSASLVSTGPAGGDGTANALFEGSSEDGSEVFFATAEKLVAADTDAVQDIYVRRDGSTTELVSEGDASCAGSNCGNGPTATALQWVSADGSLAVLSTAEALSAADGDTRADVYTRHLPGGPTTLVSIPGPTCVDPQCGDGEHNASFTGASADGAHLFFVTAEALAPPLAGDSTGPGDRDEQVDVYARSAAVTNLVSAGQLTGSGPYSGNGPFDAQLQGASSDGTVAFFVSKEQLTAEDSDVAEDVYMRSGGGTLLVSRSNDAELEAELAPPGPELVETDPESPGAATSIHVLGEEPVEATIKLYSSANCTGEPVATGTAAELNGAGIAVTVGVGSATTFHAIAEAEGFVSPCSGEVFYRQRSEEAEEEDEGGFGGFAPLPSKSVAPQTPGPLIPIPYATPHTRITFGPAAKTRIHRPVFRFTDTTEQSGTQFSCKVDHGAWQSCSSPIKLKKLKRGRHSFLVKGINGAGEVEPQPSKRKFKVVE
jgi:Tol biopolymer transport system component